MEKFFSKHKKLFLAIILALAVFFRFWHIASIPPGLFTDEAMNGSNAIEAIDTGEYKVFYQENNGREGLFINIQALSVKAFGTKPWALRIISGIFGTLTVLGLYLLTKQLFNKESVALLSSFFLATSFWHINFSRIGFRAIMAPFFLVWSFYFLFKIINQTKNNFQSWLLPIFAGFIFGLGFHSYIAYRVAPILLIPPFILLLKNKKIKLIALFLIGAFIAILPLGLYFLNHPQDFMGRTTQISIFASQSPIFNLIKNTLITLQMFFFAGDFNWRHNYAGFPQLFPVVAVMFFVGILISIKKIFKKENVGLTLVYLFLAMWFIFMLAPVVVSNEGLPHSLRSITLAPIAMIFAGLGAEYFGNKITTKKTAIIFAILLIIIPVFTYFQYFVFWAKKPEVAKSFSKEYTDIAYQINSMNRTKPVYVIIDKNRIFRDDPMDLQTIMFITRTFLPQQQKEKNIFYSTYKDSGNIPQDAQKIWLK
mgnify:CR=1 FL=1